MKKSLIALAALAATGAFAQSSVTLYGVADLSITQSKTTGSAATTGLRSDGVTNDGASRVGLRGVEDLGGGVKASFNFEQFLDLENGKSKTDYAAASQWHRAAWMSLSGDFGDMRLGRTLTPAFYGMAAWDLTGVANYSTAANKFGFVNDLGPRYDSHIAYTTPNFSGFSASVGTTLKDDNGSTGRSLAANAIYANGPLSAGLSYSKNGSNKASTGLGAKYNLGFMTLSVAYLDPSDARKGFDVGVAANLGPVNVALEAAMDTGNSKKTTDMALSARYPFSKRTMAYAVYYAGQTVNSSSKTNSLGLGIRHNF